MTWITHLMLFALALPATAVSLYLLWFTLLSRAPPAIDRSSRRLRFDVIVPAHNEAAVIEAVVANLLKLDWPVDGYRVLVIADNCTDSTAALARLAGAVVLERHDLTRRGKGYALAYAFEASQAKRWAHAVAVVDADTEVSPNLLEAFAARIESGAKAIQVHYGVLNPNDSWRTRLMAVAMAAFHRVRSRAREKLKVSCGLRGNGWCVTHRVLRRVPYHAYSLAEDIEYGIDLGLAGCRVHYADEAQVVGMMVSGDAAASLQRRRWEDGRFQLIRSRSGPLLKSASRPGGQVCLDLVLD
jgi:cellulose synthase/poly-beta-1,6-N-acetylglucosamine synthase-like glycosyltransferase